MDWQKLWSCDLDLGPSGVTCCQVLSGKGAEFHEPPQPPDGLIAHLIPDDLHDVSDGLLQLLPQLLRQWGGQGQLPPMHLRGGAAASEGQDGEGGGVDESGQRGLTGGPAERQRGARLQGAEPEQRGFWVTAGRDARQEPLQLAEKGGRLRSNSRREKREGFTRGACKSSKAEVGVDGKPCITSCFAREKQKRHRVEDTSWFSTNQELFQTLL